jgi:hypothetical protein
MASIEVPHGALPDDMSDNKRNPDSPVVARLKLLRAAHGVGSAAAMGRQLGFKNNRYENFERGHPLSAEAATRLVRAFPGLTRDWLYDGNRDGLSRQMDLLLYPHRDSA